MKPIVSDPSPARDSGAGEGTADKIFRLVTMAFAAVVVAIVLALLVNLVVASIPSIRKFGLRFAFTSTWDPVKGQFGALPLVFGTIVSSSLALLIAVPLSIGISIFLTQMAPFRLRRPVRFMVELLAGIPSVIYGLWGIFVLAPWITATLAPVLQRYLGFLPFFRGPAYGVGMLSAGLILALMVVPFVTSVSTEIMNTVPDSQKEAALGLGATRWEMVRVAVIPYSRSGIFGAVILGLGRALGETMAVTMLIGNTPQVKASLFAPAATMASIIANEFTEASSKLYLSALVEVGLLLFVITFIVNALARLLVRQVGRKRRFAG